MKSIIHFVKTRYWLSAIIGIAVVGSISFFALRGDTKAETVTVVQKDIVQTVSVTGRVTPASSVDLAFETSGRVATISATVGDVVEKDTTLVVLNSADLYADLAQAQGQLQREQIKLADLRAGTRPEDIAIAETAVNNAERRVIQSNESALDSLRDAASLADDVIRHRVDSMFENGSSYNPYLLFRAQINDSILTTDLQKERVVMSRLLFDWNKQLATIYPADDLASSFTQAKKNLQEIRSFLDMLSGAVNRLEVDTSLSQTELDQYKSEMSTARSSLASASASVNTAEQNLISDESALASAQSQLTLKKSGYTLNEIGLQEAIVRSAQGVVDSKWASIAKNVLKAPIAGIISKQDAKVGEIVPANTVVVSLLSNAQFEVEATVPEADISKVAVGNTATITLDAYGTGVVFNAQVVKVDPAEVIIDGVPTYKVTLQFSATDSRIRSGMTANIEIIAATVHNALTIPQRLITTKNSVSSVQVEENDALVTKTVTTGLRGSNGDIEILTGLAVGEKVAIPAQ